MLTLNEMMEVLTIRYTPEELVEVIGLTSGELVEEFEFKITEQYDSIMDQLEEDGYVEGSD